MFGVDILIVFFTEIIDDKTGEKERGLKKIAFQYLKTTFLIDLLAFFPFFELFRFQMVEDKGENKYNFYHILYLLRLLRMYKAAQLLSPNYVFAVIKSLHKAYLKMMHERLTGSQLPMIAYHDPHDDQHEDFELGTRNYLQLDLLCNFKFGFLISR